MDRGITDRLACKSVRSMRWSRRKRAALNMGAMGCKTGWTSMHEKMYVKPARSLGVWWALARLVCGNTLSVTGKLVEKRAGHWSIGNNEFLSSNFRIRYLVIPEMRYHNRNERGQTQIRLIVTIPRSSRDRMS